MYPQHVGSNRSGRKAGGQGQGWGRAGMRAVGLSARNQDCRTAEEEEKMDKVNVLTC